MRWNDYNLVLRVHSTRPDYIEIHVTQMLAINDTLDATGQDRFSDEDMSALAGAATVLKPFGKLGVEVCHTTDVFIKLLYL